MLEQLSILKPVLNKNLYIFIGQLTNRLFNLILLIGKTIFLSIDISPIFNILLLILYLVIKHFSFNSSKLYLSFTHNSNNVLLGNKKLFLNAPNKDDFIIK